MRIGLLTEGGYPCVSGDAGLWRDRLVHGLVQHDFDIYALSLSERQEDAGRIPLPPRVGRVRTAPLWTADDDGVGYGRRARRRFAECYGELAAAVCTGAGFGDAGAGVEDRFGSALYGLAELARDEGGGLVGVLRSEAAVRALESACRAPGALRPARDARVPDLLTVVAQVERALRPLSLDWYEETGGLGSVDLCHATSGGAVALPGLLARHFSGVPLLVTEYEVQLRAYYLSARSSRGSSGPAGIGGLSGSCDSSCGSCGSCGSGGTREPSPSARALVAAFHGRLTAEVYRQAALITPGDIHARRWQERCGADRAKLRTVYPGMDASRFSDVGERGGCADPATLVWVGRIEPAKDLISLLHAFAEIRKEQPKAMLRIVGAPVEGPDGVTYLAHCKALAAQLFPDEAEGLHAVGDNPVSFEEIGGPEMPSLAEAYAAGAVVVLSSVVEGFPISLVEAMFCGRATVSTDAGAVVEVIGGTGLVVPPRNPRALAEACLALLRDPERRERLGAAARARALELFTAEQNITAFDRIYLEIVSHYPVHRLGVDSTDEPLPFAVPAGAHMPGRWIDPGTRLVAAGGAPRWAARRSASTAPAAWSSSKALSAPAPTGSGSAQEPVPAGEGPR